MANGLKSLGWWVLGAVLLLAPMGGELARMALGAPAEATSPADSAAAQGSRTAPLEARWMGAVTTEYQSAGEAIASGAPYRDLTFHLDATAPIELVGFAYDQPMRYRVFNAAGEETAVLEVPANGELSIQTTGSEGRENRIRVERVAGDQQATFRVRIRRVS